MRSFWNGFVMGLCLLASLLSFAIILAVTAPAKPHQACSDIRNGWKC